MQLWVEQKPYGYIYHNDYGLVFSKHHFTDTKNTELTAVYTHPQPDQTTLINQLTDELNKTEAERAKWKAIALTSQIKRKPLSEDEIMQIVNAHEGDTIGVC
jgi:hypothetical protein